MSDPKANPSPVKCLVTILDRGMGETAIDVLNPIYKTEYMIILGKGTAGSEIMDYLGLDEPEKDVLITLFPPPSGAAHPAGAGAGDGPCRTGQRHCLYPAVRRHQRRTAAFVGGRNQPCAIR